MTSTRLPGMTIVRSMLFNLYFVLLTLGMGLLAFWVRLFGRRHALAYATLWCRLSIAGLQRICRIRIEVTGREHLPDGPVLIASQHQSAFDTLIWLTLLPRPAYVMKRELTRLPLVGPMLLLAGMIPVDRGAGARALRRLLGEAARAVADRRQIVIFPEGTRVAAGGAVALQPGIAALAAHTGLQVVPVATDSGRCWSRQAFIKRAGVIHIAIAPSLPAGLRRQRLLDGIREAWRDEESRMGRGTTKACAHRHNLVDNSVGRRSAQV